MVFVTPYVSIAALFIGLVAGAPMPKPDSAIGAEEAVSAPDGTPESSTPMAQATAMPYAMGGGMDTTMMMDTTSAMMMDTTSAKMMDATSTKMKDATSTMMMESTSTMMMESTSTMMMKATSTMMMESSSTMMAQATATAAYGSYGSGSYNSGGSSYNNCVQQCMATLGTGYSAPPTATAASSMNNSSSGSSGTGATHTVVVAPTQGVLRYVPFAINASVGDTVLFMWGANNHTVTKSSQLEICNKTSDAPFATGEQNKSFTFTQVVNDTNTTFFYCGTPGHCEKGMFGMINPPSVGQGQLGSVAATLPTMMANSSSMTAMQAYTNSMTANNSAAAAWGSAMDMTNIPDWAQESFAENVMYTRTFLAANPEVINADGTISMSNLGANPLMVPQDITVAAASAAPSSAAAVTAVATGTSSPGTPASTAGALKSANGARSLKSSGVLIGVVAALLGAVVAF